MSDVTVQVSKFISAGGPQHSWKPDGKITIEVDGKLITGEPVPLLKRDMAAVSETHEARSAEPSDFEMSI